jgi:hypothetical protein
MRAEGGCQEINLLEDGDLLLLNFVAGVLQGFLLGVELGELRLFLRPEVEEFGVFRVEVVDLGVELGDGLLNSGLLLKEISN